MSKPTLEERKATIQSDINGKVNIWNDKTNQRNALNSQLSKLRDELNQLQAQLNLINDMMGVKVEEKETPKKDEKKK